VGFLKQETEGTIGKIMNTKHLVRVGEIRDLEVVDEDGIPVAKTSLVVARDGNIVVIFLAASSLPVAHLKLGAAQELPDFIRIINGEVCEVCESKLVWDGGWIRVGAFQGSRLLALEFPPGKIHVQVDRITLSNILVRI
jgi:hypothetical protein